LQIGQLELFRPFADWMKKEGKNGSMGRKVIVCPGLQQLQWRSEAHGKTHIVGLHPRTDLPGLQAQGRAKT
jgi:hypothetical protein